MKILILFMIGAMVAAGGLFFAFVKIDRRINPAAKEIQSNNPEKEIPKALLVEDDGDPQKDLQEQISQGVSETLSIKKEKPNVVIGSYEFKNRVAPPIPSTFELVKEESFVLQLDEVTNSWVWIISDKSVLDPLAFAQTLDLPQTEMDLDFVLVAISEDWLRSQGLSAAFREGATFLNALDLGFSTSGLTLAVDGLSVSLDYGKSNASVRLVSSPTVRTYAGQPFRFETVQRIPFPVVEVVDGVSRTSYRFEDAGLILSGMVRDIGGTLRMQLDQSNGNPVETAAEVPVIERETLSTSLGLLWGRWSVAGGIRTHRRSTTKGLLGKRESASDDLLVIFVRPRFTLSAVPRAVPVFPSLDRSTQNIFSSNPLLPSKSAFLNDEERQLIQAQLARPAK